MKNSEDYKTNFSKILVTKFDTKTTLNPTKSPISPFDDKTFIFENIEVPNSNSNNSNQFFYNIIVSNFILNLPLRRISRPIRTQRTVQELTIFQDKFNYIIIDIAISSQKNKQSTLDYFKPFKCILGESRSYNDYDNFNLKGIIFTEELTYSELKIVFANLQSDIKDYGYLNDNSIRRNSITAPILKNKVLLDNQDGTLLVKVHRNISEFISEFSLDNEDIGTVDSIKNVTGKSIQEICLGTFRILGFNPIKENSNSSITFEKDKDETYFWFKNSPYVMHNPNRLKSLNIFNTIKNNKDYKEITTNDINYKELLDFKLGKDFFFCESDMQVSGKEKIIEDFLYKRNGLLSIKSPMGTGKSNLISYIIDECHNDDLRVLVITNRISVAEDFSRKYKNVKLYNKDVYNIGDSLIVQYDSLWKYSITNFDIVIMDEFTSLLLHSRENLSNNTNNLMKFFGCFSKKLIIADAFLTGYEHRIIQKDLVNEDNIINITNTYRDSTKLTTFEDKNRFIEAIIKHSVENAKWNTSTTISCTSTNMIIALKIILEKQGLKVITLTADTPKVTKELIYEHFSKIDNKWDVLIFSPTLTVGVSNMNQVEDHFHYDSGNSADVISSIQMIKRSRRAKNIHYFIQNKVNYVCTDYNTLRDTYMNNRVEDMSYLFDVDDYGESRLSKNGVKAIKIDILRNILMFNHKKAFEWLLSFHFDSEARVINETSNNIINNYIKEASTFLKNEKLRVKDSIREYELISDFKIKKENPKVFEIIDTINQKFKDLDYSQKDEVITESILDTKFLSKVRYFKILTSGLDIKEINNRLSLAVLNNDKEDILFFTNLLYIKNNNISKLKQEYLPSELSPSNMKAFRSILISIGYTFKTRWKINTKVKNFKDYYIE